MVLKRLLAVVICLLLAVSMVGCGSSETAQQPEKSNRLTKRAFLLLPVTGRRSYVIITRPLTMPNTHMKII